LFLTLAGLLLLPSQASAAPVKLTVDGAVEYQTMEGFGVNWPYMGNLVYTMEEDADKQKLVELFFHEKGLNLTLIRVRFLHPDNFKELDGQFKGGTYNGSAFSLDEPVYTDIIKRGKRGSLTKVVLTVYGAPSYMTVTSNGKTTLPSSNYGQLAAFFVDYLKALKDKYGITTDYFSVQNEPDLVPVWEHVYYESSALPKMVKAARLALDKAGIKALIVGPDTTGVSHSLTYFDKFLPANNGGDGSYLKAVTAYSFHQYQGSFAEPNGQKSDLIKVAAKAKAASRPVYMTEYGNCSDTWDTKGQAAAGKFDEVIYLAWYIHNALYHADAAMYLTHHALWWDHDGTGATDEAIVEFLPCDQGGE